MHRRLHDRGLQCNPAIAAPSPTDFGISCRPTSDRRCATITFNNGEHAMGKSQDAKKNVKKAPTKTPKEKKEAKRLKKAEKKH
jgi:hypothetical protein